jgi:hypothetical protein
MGLLCAQNGVLADMLDVPVVHLWPFPTPMYTLLYNEPTHRLALDEGLLESWGGFNPHQPTFVGALPLSLVPLRMCGLSGVRCQLRLAFYV